MAILQMTMMSQALMRTVPVTVVLPFDKMLFPGMQPRQEGAYKTLYLLHGVIGSTLDWLSGTRIERFAVEHDLCVVMPSGDNAFYLDHPERHDYYGDFIGRELVELTRKAFPLSHRREDTFLGGLSMGGYGALRNGLKYHETFGAVCALSSALLLDELQDRKPNAPFFLESREYAEACFGELSKVAGSDKDPLWLAKQLQKSGAPLPLVYMACGRQDPLLPANDKFAAALQSLGYTVTYEVDPGAHEWDFWDTHIRRAIDWLPLGNAASGVSSGNVGI